MTTATDVFAAFQRWRAAAKNFGVLMLFNDGSGCVRANGSNSEIAVSFDSFADAVAQLDKATDALKPKPQIGDALWYGNYMFRVTDLYNGQRSVRADRAAYLEPDFVVYAPYDRLKQRSPVAGGPAWDIT